MYTYFYISPETQRCPEQHIYKECGPSNPATCSNVAPFQDSECVSGCTCPEGSTPMRVFTLKQNKSQKQSGTQVMSEWCLIYSTTFQQFNYF